MKRVLAVLLSLALSFSFCTSVFAEGSKTATIEVIDEDIQTRAIDAEVPSCPTRCGIVFYRTLYGRAGGRTTVQFRIDADLKAGQQVLVFYYNGTEWLRLEGVTYADGTTGVEKRSAGTPNGGITDETTQASVDYTYKDGVLTVTFDDLGPVAIGICSAGLSSPKTGGAANVPLLAGGAIALCVLAAGVVTLRRGKKEENKT